MSGSHPGPQHSLPLVVALAVLAFSAGPLHGATSTFSAQNWSGYVVEQLSGTTAQTGVANYVSGSWIVPAITESPTAGASASECCNWVGFDGFNDGSVEQLGTVCSIVGGSTSYYAWYDMYPSGVVNEFPVHPGDSITASVEYNAPGHSGAYMLSLTDNTTLGTFTIYGTNSTAQRSSAEWIMEAPEGTYEGIYPLPSFGSTTFTGATATLGTETGPVDDPNWQTVLVNLNHTADKDVLTTLPPTDLGSGTAATSTFTIVQQTPEPSALALLLAALAGVGVVCRWRRKSQAKG
jgi:hypothetical protein